MILDLWTFDVGVEADSVEKYAEACFSRVEQSWVDGADAVIFPEFCWMGLERFSGREKGLIGVSDLFWKQVWPLAQERLSHPDKAVVLGTAPYADAETSAVRNRAPILVSGRAQHQDKLHLTPWESAFSPGEEIRLWRFGGLTFAVVICLDIEVPELAAQLRPRGVDVILVPSATETALGVERVDRCACARAVELGCYVGVAHLTGRAESDLIDENIGRTAFYTPSQASFRNAARVVESPIVEAGFQRLRCDVELRALAKMRAARAETNPARLQPKTCLSVTLD